MLEALRDGAWQAIIGLLGVLIAVVVFILQIRKKSLAYEIITSSPIMTMKDNVRGRIKILFDDRQVTNVHLVEIRITNDGNIPILPADFHSKIEFAFKNSSKVLTADVIKTSPKDLNPQILSTEENVVFEPLLLNGGDSITVKLLIDGTEISPDVRGRIVGVKNIRKKQKISRRKLIFAIPFFGLLGSILMVISIYNEIYLYFGFPMLLITAGLMVATDEHPSNKNSNVIYVRRRN